MLSGMCILPPVLYQVKVLINDRLYVWLKAFTDVRLYETLHFKNVHKVKALRTFLN